MKVLCAIITLGIAGMTIGYVPQDSRLSYEGHPCANRQIGSRVNDKSSCNAYCFCTKTGASPERCSGLAVFHPVLETCVSVVDYSCVDTIQYPNVCHCRANGDKVNNEKDCSAYWLCTADGPILSACENGYKFDAKLEVCVLSADCGVDDTVDSIPPSPCYGVANGQFIDNPKNCQAYYYCFDNRHHEGECKNGLSFNPENQWCDWQYYCKNKPRVNL